MGEWKQDDFDITCLDVMEPVMYVHDGLRVIYINEAFEEKLEDKGSEETKRYQAATEETQYPTRLRRIPITVEFMRRYAGLRRDDYMLELIARKESVLREDDDQYEISLFYAFKNMFLAKYPECRNVFKAIRRMDEYEAKHPGKA